MLGSTTLEVVAKVAALGLALVAVFLADADPTGMVAPASWAGAGLLGGVLAWLLFVHLPGKDKLLKELIANHQEQVTALAKQSLEARSTDRLELIAAIKEHTHTILGRIDDRALREREQTAILGDRKRQKEAGQKEAHP